MLDTGVLLAIGGGLLAVVFAGLLTVFVLRQPPGTQRMVEIASAIQEGASAYLNRQYMVIGIIGLIIAIIIGVAINVETAILYLVGAVLSAAMLLRHSFQLEREALAIESAARRVLGEGNRTRDLVPPGKAFIGTREMGQLIVRHIRSTQPAAHISRA